jgi:hypothetical protein
MYEEMVTYKEIRVFFVTGNKKQLELANVSTYYHRGVKKYSFVCEDKCMDSYIRAGKIFHHISHERFLGNCPQLI